MRYIDGGHRFPLQELSSTTEILFPGLHQIMEQPFGKYRPSDSARFVLDVFNSAVNHSCVLLLLFVEGTYHVRSDLPSCWKILPLNTHPHMMR